jgi:methyltransferase (TIGR00027 family)
LVKPRKKDKDMDGVGKTSLLTAAMRSLETKRSDAEGRFFSDPYAELLAGTEGMALLQKALQESGDQPAIAVRTKYMDEKINHALQHGIRQIVIIAAGMDTRAYRLSLPTGTRIFELDRQEVLSYKHEKLGNTQPLCERQALPVDLQAEWPAQLLKSSFKSGQPTLWLVEGLLMYLEESQVNSLFTKINSLSSPKDVMLFDVLGRSLLEAPFMKKQLEFLANMGAPWRFGENEPEQLMKKFGWEATATLPGEFAPSRWPFPTPPRSVPNVPRSFFVEARKLEKTKG